MSASVTPQPPQYAIVSIFSGYTIFSESGLYKLFSHCDLIFILMSMNDVKQRFVYLHLFAVAVVTNYQKFNVFKQHRFIILQFWRSEVLKLRCQQD